MAPAKDNACTNTPRPKIVHPMAATSQEIVGSDYPITILSTKNKNNPFAY